jgi:hypothetical protein
MAFDCIIGISGHIARAQIFHLEGLYLFCEHFNDRSSVPVFPKIFPSPLFPEFSAEVVHVLDLEFPYRLYIEGFNLVPCYTIRNSRMPCQMIHKAIDNGLPILGGVDASFFIIRRFDDDPLDLLGICDRCITGL